MIDPRPGERVYLALRRAVLAGRYPPGGHIEVAPVAAEMGASLTPTREALARLTGEGLVEIRPLEGFFVVALAEDDLRDLYAWTELLLVAVIAASRGARAAPPPRAEGEEVEPTERYARATAALFAALAARSPNLEHRRAVDRASNRLHLVRRLEPLVLDGAEAELAEIGEIADTAALRTALRRFHRRRTQSAPQLVRLARGPRV